MVVPGQIVASPSNENTNGTATALHGEFLLAA